MGGKAAEVETPANLEALQLTEAVVAFGGSDNLARLLSETARAAKDLHPMAANVPMMFSSGLQQNLGLTSMDGVDLTRPVRFAVFDPKKYEGGPVALCLTLSTKKKFIATLPQNKKEKDKGNAYSVATLGGQTIYFNLLDSFVVVTHKPELFGKHKDDLTSLVTTRGQGDIKVLLEVGNLRKLYEDEIETGLKEMEQGLEGSKDPQGVQGLAALKSMSGWGREVMAETKRVILNYGVTSESLRLTAAVIPNKGSGFAKTIGAFEGSGAPKLLDSLPADSAAFMAGKMDPEKTQDLISRMMRFTMSVMPGKMPESYMEATKKFWKSTDGEFVSGLYSAPEGGVAMVGLYIVVDHEAAAASMKEMMGLYKNPAYMEMMKKLKMEVELNEAAYKVGDVTVATMATKMPGMDQASGFSKIFNAFTTTHLGLGKKQGIYAFGPSARAAVEAFLGGKVKGGLASNKGVKAALSAAAPGATVWIYGAAAGLAKLAFSAMGADSSKMALPEADGGACLSFGAKGGQLNAALDLPVNQLKVIAGVMRQMGGAMGGPRPSKGL